MIECQLCGTPNDDAAHYCVAWNCGSRLGALPQGRGVQLSLPDWTPELVPGQVVVLTATVRNAGSRPDTVAVTVQGLPPGCASVDPAQLALAAGAEAPVRITLHPPLALSLPVGTLPCLVVAVSRAAAEAAARARLRPRLLPPPPPPAAGSAQVASVPAASVPAGPVSAGGAALKRRLRWRRVVTVPLRLTGTGPAAERITLAAACSSPEAVVRLTPPSVLVKPGATAAAQVRLRLPRHWLRPPEWVECRVAGTAAEGGPVLAIAHWPVLPLPLLWLLSPAVRRWFGDGGRAGFAAGTAVWSAGRSAAAAGRSTLTLGTGGYAATPQRRISSSPAHARRLLRLPAPVATALGAVVVAGLAFGGLTLASGSTVAPGRSALGRSATGRPGATVTGTPPLNAVENNGSPVSSTSSGSPRNGGDGAAVPLQGPVTTTARKASAATGCQGSATVPNVSGLTYPASSQALLDAGFPGLDIAEHSATLAAGRTISVSPAQGSRQSCGAQITLVYSDGPAPATTPGTPAAVVPLCTLPAADGTATAVLAELRSLVASDHRTRCGLQLTEMTGYSATVPAGRVIGENPLPGTQLGVGSAVIITVSLGAPTCVLPNVVGATSASATTLLGQVRAADGSACRLAVATVAVASARVPVSTVVSQSPAAATVVAPGAVVTLDVSDGPATTVPATCVLPGVVGLQQAAAISRLGALTASDGTGCDLATSVTTVASTTVAVGVVIAQTPVAATAVQPGSAVLLTVSGGPNGTTPPPSSPPPSSSPPGTTPPPTSTPTTGGASGGPSSSTAVSASSVSKAPATCSLPNVAGLTAASATTQFGAATSTAGTACGLVVLQADESSTLVATGLVINQVPGPGATVAVGSTVTINISTGPPAATGSDSASVGA